MGAQVINHLGLVSAAYDNLGIDKILNRIFPKHENSKLSISDCTKILTLNGLGFTGRPLYLAAEFFRNKPVDMLIGDKVSVDDINDDVLGRALDAIYEANPTLLFSQIAYQAAKIHNIDTSVLHGDTSSKIMFGSYDPIDGQPDIVKYGYSKDKRPDLKQLMYSLLISNEGNFPLFGGVLPGNTSDTVHFREAIAVIRDNFKFIDKDTIVVFDSKLHTEETIREIKEISWVTRVPEASKIAKKTLINSLDFSFDSIIEGYSGKEVIVKHAGIKQRWLVVRSEQAHKSAKHSVARSVIKEKEAFDKMLKKINRLGFSCESDAQKALKKEIKKLKYHTLDTYKTIEKIKHLRRGKPTITTPKESTFTLEIVLAESLVEVEKAIEKKSRFIVATNILDAERLSTVDLLKTYKDQYKVERGFRFLKNPLCMARAVYLKKQSRIVALGFIMLLGLLIYSAIEHATRRALESHNETIPNQLRKPTQKPTARWLFELFEDVVIITIYQAGKILTKQVMNLRDELKKVLRLLGPTYCQMYHVS